MFDAGGHCLLVVSSCGSYPFRAVMDNIMHNLYSLPWFAIFGRIASPIHYLSLGYVRP